jgi:hypothetical protein
VVDTAAAITAKRQFANPQSAAGRVLRGPLTRELSS